MSAWTWESESYPDVVFDHNEPPHIDEVREQVNEAVRQGHFDLARQWIDDPPLAALTMWDWWTCSMLGAERLRSVWP